MSKAYVNNHKPYGPYERFFKRPLDFLCGLLPIVLLCWLYAIVAILVRVKLGSPVIFKQERPGKNEKLFNIYKFRTMTDARDKDGNLLSDDERITKFGKILRSTSLDEIPAACNLLNGTMSVVGPRPLLISYLPYYTDTEKYRHDVTPGITGLAQINGRNSISWDDKLKYDVAYVNKITFLGDVKIVFKTIAKVLTRADIKVGSEFKAGNFIQQRKERQLSQNDK